MIFRNYYWLQLFPVLVMLVMVTCAVYQILTSVFKVAVLSIVVACYLGVSIYQALNEDDVEPAGRWLAGVLVVFFMACLVAHSQHTEATYRSNIRTRSHFNNSPPPEAYATPACRYISNLHVINLWSPRGISHESLRLGENNVADRRRTDSSKIIS